jgi:ABC-type sugar transport system ATPase subunit
MAMARIELRDLRKRFGGVAVIHGVDLTIESGELVVFVGPSGCGKSTLLRLIAGLEDISGGELLIAGRRVNALPPAKRGVAMVFQSYALYPHLDVFENMAFGLRLAELGRAEIERRVRATAATLELTPLLDRLPRQLSGGQRQRVAIGRAIVREPEVFLFDEPLSNLDAALRVQMRLELAKLHQRLTATTIYVTHDQVEAMTLADRIIVLNAGRIEQVGSPLELYNRPANLFVAGFIGSPRMNVLTAAIEPSRGGAIARLAGGIAVEVPVSATRAVQGSLGLRPERLTIGGGAVSLPARIDIVEQLGEAQFVHAVLDGGAPITLKVPGQRPLARGAEITIGVDPATAHLFGADGNAMERAAT